MNFVGLVLHAFRALMVFAEDVLVRVGLLCSFIATLSVLFAMLAVILKLIGFAMRSSLFADQMCSLCCD
jgi:hypothetical protein